MSDPRYYQVEQDRDGFFIVDDEGEEVEPRRYTSEASAKQALDEMVEDFMDNYEPPDPPDPPDGQHADKYERAHQMDRWQRELKR